MSFLLFLIQGIKIFLISLVLLQEPFNFSQIFFYKFLHIFVKLRPPREACPSGKLIKLKMFVENRTVNESRENFVLSMYDTIYLC